MLKFEVTGYVESVVEKVAEQNDWTPEQALAWLVQFTDARLKYLDEGDLEDVPDTGEEYGVKLAERS